MLWYQFEVLSLRRKLQTNLTTNINEMNSTRFMWKTLISGKNQGNVHNISQWEKTKYNHGMIEPDLVWACTETTIWPERIKPQHVDIYPPLKLPKLLCFSFYSSVLHTSFFLSLSFWVISLTQPLVCFSLSRSLCYTSLATHLFALLHSRAFFSQ